MNIAELCPFCNAVLYGGFPEHLLTNGLCYKKHLSKIREAKKRSKKLRKNI